MRTGLSSVEIYLVAVPGWPGSVWCWSLRDRRTAIAARREAALTAVVAVLMLCGAALAGSVEGPLRPGHCDVRDHLGRHPGRDGGRPTPTRPACPGRRHPRGCHAVLRAGQRDHRDPAGLLPSWLAMAATSVDLLLLGTAVVLWDAFDEGQVLRAAMLRSFLGTIAVAALFGGQVLAATLLIGPSGQARICLPFCCSAASPSRSPSRCWRTHWPVCSTVSPSRGHRNCFADRAACLRTTEGSAAVALTEPAERSRRWFRPVDPPCPEPLRRPGQTGRQSTDSTARIDARLAERRASDQPLERAAELRAILPSGSTGSKPRDGENSAPPSSGATTTRSTFPMSSASALTRRTPRRRA